MYKTNNYRKDIGTKQWWNAKKKYEKETGLKYPIFTECSYCKKEEWISSYFMENDIFWCDSCKYKN
jgi:hypothetical protein